MGFASGDEMTTRKALALGIMACEEVRTWHKDAGPEWAQAAAELRRLLQAERARAAPADANRTFESFLPR